METFDAIVIGSGFGGAVCACRLAQAGLKVAILERGRRYDAANSFPRDWDNPLHRWLYATEQGLFDIKPIEEMFVVQAAGYGGGSLIYANVHLRCPEDVFAKAWPKGYSRAALDPYYDLVAYMLGIQPITKAPSLPPKTEAMKKVAADLGRTKQFVYPNLAVTFGDPNVPVKNAFGATQTGCNFCGECVIGCTTAAKNTLDLNYLKVAETKGAKVFTQCAATRITPKGDETNRRYDVEWNDFTTGQTQSAEATAVFICAGAISTTELLLRCRDEHKTLPDLSPRLGEQYSGNGDFLGFAFDTKEPIEPSKGPTITTGIVYDDGRKDEDRTWFILEEGGYPKEVDWLIQLMHPLAGLSGRPGAFRDAIGDAIRNGIGNVTGRAPIERTAVFLSMGRDRADGRIALEPVPTENRRALRVFWKVSSNRVLYDTEGRLNTDVAKALGGDVGFPPTWELFDQPISVHNLGGCVMAEKPTGGVIDCNGKVHGYENLYVMDGAALPSATGVNPAHTIAAVAERNVEAAIRKLTNKPTWQAPELPVPTIVDPLASITLPSPPPNTSKLRWMFRAIWRFFCGR